MTARRLESDIEDFRTQMRTELGDLDLSVSQLREPGREDILVIETRVAWRLKKAIKRLVQNMHPVDLNVF